MKIKILCIVNTILPKVCDILNIPHPWSGGWLVSFIDNIAKINGFTLSVATVYSGKEVKKIEIDGIIYYLLPQGKSLLKYNKTLEPYWKDICNSFSPDIIHLHGTENNFGLACIKACPGEKYIVSIQGLCSVIERYYYSGIEMHDLLFNITLRDIIRSDNIFRKRREFRRRGVFEKEIIKSVSHIIGRTRWDEVHTMTINPDVRYHFCNDNLQDAFYKTTKTWNINSIERYTIYVSQGYYPIKGVHMLIRAAQIVKANFPELKIYVAGLNILKGKSIYDRLSLSGYGKYLRKLIINLGLAENISFVGLLTPDEVIEKLVHSHICVYPSSIENGSSLGEAQYLGTPVIASYAGGMPSTVIDEVNGLLYRFEEYEMLAHNIVRIFNDNTLAVKLSENGKVTAMERHNSIENINNMLSIYKKVLD